MGSAEHVSIFGQVGSRTDNVLPRRVELYELRVVQIAKHKSRTGLPDRQERDRPHDLGDCTRGKQAACRDKVEREARQIL